MKKRKKICFAGDLSTSFIMRDYEVLERYFDVRATQPPKLSKKDGASKYLALIVSAVRYAADLAKNVNRSDLTFSWFAGWHSAFTVFFSKLFGKRSIVIAGGYDCAAVDEIGYGAFLRRNFLWEGLPAAYVFKNVDKILIVDPSLKDDIIRNVGINGEKIECVPTGYDSNYWEPGEKGDVVLTVGTVSEAVVKRKGFETFVRAAHHLPDVKFVLVGKQVDDSIDRLRSQAPPNLEFTGFVDDQELLKLYQRARVYCQLSRYEGLPNALCEAMLCECAPVGTRYCGIPNAIGETGIYVPYGDVKATAEAIKRALDGSLGKKARKRISAMFPMERREKRLIESIELLSEKI